MTATSPTAAALVAGATYKLVVRSAEEAVQTIREKLGERAKVLSVRQLPGQGIGGLFRRPRLEVIAQIAGEGVVDTNQEVLTALAQAATLDDRSEPNETPERSAQVDRTSPARSESVERPHDRVAASAPTNDFRQATAASRLPDLLRRSGFSESLMGRLQASPAFSQSAHRQLHHALADFGQALRTSAGARPTRALPARTAFLGSAGSGRTTALSKWLAREVFGRSRTGRVVKAEFDRPNPAEGLAVFCEALGLGLQHYLPNEDGSAAIAAGSPQTFVYADLPGLSLKSPTENAAIARFLKTEKFDGRVLVLNALYDLSSMRAAYTAGRDLGATHLVFTHLDELSHWGKLWDFLIDGELSPLFLATGPSLTGDLEEDAIGAVLRKTLPGA